MKTESKPNTEPANSRNTMLAAGANVSPRNEAHGLEGFGSGANVRPASWCAGLTKVLFISSLVTAVVLIVVQFYELPKAVNLSLILLLICQPFVIVLVSDRNKYKRYS